MFLENIKVRDLTLGLVIFEKIIAAINPYKPLDYSLKSD